MNGPSYRGLYNENRVLDKDPPKQYRQLSRPLYYGFTAVQTLAPRLETDSQSLQVLRQRDCER